MNVAPIFATRDLVLKALEEADTDCQELQTLIVSYKARIDKTTEKEMRVRLTKEGSAEEKRALNGLGHAVRLEAVCARRIILHLLQRHL